MAIAQKIVIKTVYAKQQSDLMGNFIENDILREKWVFASNKS